MNKLAKSLIRLGNQNPELRRHLRPILDEITSSRPRLAGRSHYRPRGKDQAYEMLDDLVMSLGAESVVQGLLYAMNQDDRQSIVEYIFRMWDVDMDVSRRDSTSDLMDKLEMAFGRLDDRVVDALAQAMNVTKLENAVEGMRQDWGI